MTRNFVISLCYYNLQFPLLTRLNTAPTLRGSNPFMIVLQTKYHTYVPKYTIFGPLVSALRVSHWVSPRAQAEALPIYYLYDI